MMRRRLAVFVTASAVLALAGCGGGKSSSAPAKTTPTHAQAKAPVTTKAAGQADSSGGGRVLAGVACPPSGAATSGTRTLGSQGVESDYTINAGYRAVLDGCTSALESAGWTVRGSGGGGWGNDGGGGLGATKGAANVDVEAGSNGGATSVNVCAWPSAKSNDSCGDSNNDGQNDNNNQNDNQNQNGNNNQNNNQNQNDNNN